MTAFTPAHRGGSGEPMVCLHGFTDTWRTWELVLDDLERSHDVLAPTLPGHAGGLALAGPMTDDLLPDAVERAMDRAGLATAHLVGNSLGGYLALRLAARGRARSVVALAPAGGWARGDPAAADVLEIFAANRAQLAAVAPQAGQMLSTRDGRRRATQLFVANFDHIPTDLLAHQMLGVVRCDGLEPMVAHAARAGFPLEPERIACPVRIIWGTADRVLPWPSAAARYRDGLPHADWVELEGVGHCPQLDVPLETAQLILGVTRRAGAPAAGRRAPR
jgi:pimeloyl-ACP methyl ester carboxylesterase